MINDLLDMEKISAGKMQFRFSRQSLSALLEQALESNRAYGARRGVTLVFAGELPDVRIWVDPQRLMQVLRICSQMRLNILLRIHP